MKNLRDDDYSSTMGRTCSEYVRNGASDGIPSMASDEELKLFTLMNEYRSDKGWLKWEWSDELHKASFHLCRYIKGRVDAGQTIGTNEMDPEFDGLVDFVKYYGYHPIEGTSAKQNFAKLREGEAEFVWDKAVTTPGVGLTLATGKLDDFIDVGVAFFEGCWVWMVAEGNSCVEDEEVEPGGLGSVIAGPDLGGPGSVITGPEPEQKPVTGPGPSSSRQCCCSCPNYSCYGCYR